VALNRVNSRTENGVAGNVSITAASTITVDDFGDAPLTASALGSGTGGNVNIASLSGDILLQDGIDAGSPGGAATNGVVLSAGDDILLNTPAAVAAINMSGSSGDLVLRADADGNGTGSTSAPNGGTLAMGTGGLLLQAATGIGSSASPINTTGTTTLSAGNTTSGDIQLTNTGGAL
jgi:hypothetical protein